MSKAQVTAASPPITALLQVQLCHIEIPSKMVTAARCIEPQLPAKEVIHVASLVIRRWFYFTLHSSLLSSVHIHAVLGGGGPKWQPLNVAGRHALFTRHQLESVLAGDNGNGGIQLRLDENGACLQTGGRLMAATAERLWLRQRWNPNSVIFVYNS
jgi:hypothetical protein